ncbi:MAG: hypothetical protein EHM79_00375 [Geobacter sp.]|nr:MAG: hypothetical protein EHM79_00375 [Geobacter sp.]
MGSDLASSMAEDLNPNLGKDQQTSDKGQAAEKSEGGEVEKEETVGSGSSTVDEMLSLGEEDKTDEDESEDSTEDKSEVIQEAEDKDKTDEQHKTDETRSSEFTPDVLAELSEVAARIGWGQAVEKPTVEGKKEDKAPAGKGVEESGGGSQGIAEIDFFKDIPADAEIDRKAINKSLNMAVQSQAELMLKQVPGMISGAVQYQLGMMMLVNKFYSDNPDLDSVTRSDGSKVSLRPLVGQIAQELAASKPELANDPVKLYEATAVRMREKFGIRKNVAARPQGANFRGTPPRQDGPRVGGGPRKLSTRQDDLEYSRKTGRRY